MMIVSERCNQKAYSIVHAGRGGVGQKGWGTPHGTLKTGAKCDPKPQPAITYPGSFQPNNSTKKKNDDFGPVHGGDALPFMGGPMRGQYHLRMRL